jgi:hypothetical protein
MDMESLLASMLVSGIGYVAFKYGRSQERFPQVAVGFTMMAFPYFVSNVWLMFGIAAALLALLFALVKLGL